ncbi:tRNA (adenosine(37)-N6)-dimethylallyltransferase MiaA [Virgibacillus sp. C22-A2]|uniref:tRNA dimethylallyltransferase n=1 Tax=Virgibacillus tibetensis TaxID=3042313 RepID=A0ABU6KBT6_9BACI|nr:tRNA (adenosine(37)-N6)-dimethylallyltransferase MiaA [Virgibacillus sp. C22-A2]
MKKTVIAIVGPTAVGKTKLSIEIAKRYNGEVISGDSMQVYKGMDIGTAKITNSEMQGIPHYMLDIKEPNENFSAADFQYYVQNYIDKITGSGKIPIIVGGSGLYIQAALYNYNFSETKRDDSITNRLEKEIEKIGITPLYQRLKKVDPEQAEKIHPNNYRRVIRALEIYETTGLTMTDYQQKQNLESPYNIVFIGLEMDRELLYNRINQRIEKMMEDGLLNEVQRIYEQGSKDSQSMSAIGYKEFIPYFRGEQNLEHCVNLLKRNSRRYAKRQYTWFRNRMDINWYTVTPELIKEKFRIILADLAGFLESK